MIFLYQNIYGFFYEIHPYVNNKLRKIPNKKATIPELFTGIVAYEFHNISKDSNYF